MVGTSPIRVVLADDQPSIRAGFRFFLDSQPDIAVVGEASDGVEAVELARRLRPDVCLLDIRMPGMDGLEATRLIAGPSVGQPIPVVIITTFDTDEYLDGAIANGATGFLRKDAGPVLVVEAVRAAAIGDSLVSPSITLKLLERLASARSPSGDRDQTPRSPGGALTRREVEIATLVARARTNGEIARELHISLSTVKTHLATMQTKLDARNRVDIAAWAWRSGLVDP